MGREDAILLFLSIALPALVGLHLFVAPYTKVEESFHIQAVHDLLVLEIPTRNVSDVLRAEYDHFSFPGAVPRTFVGAVLLSGMARPFLWVKESIDGQILVRGILGVLNALSLLWFASGMRRTFGKTTAMWYLLFQTSQFHIIYYASRTLSNMFAFCLSTLALRFLLPDPVASDVYRRRCRLALFLLTMAGIIFRSELALLLGTNTIFLFLTGRISIRQDIIPAGALGLVLGLALTVSVDSFFWQQFPLWPELAAFKFNVVSGHASAWGTHSWHFYFTNALPRLLLNPLSYLVGVPLAVLQHSTRSAAIYLLMPALAFIAIYSLQPHKEWRFIVYTVPTFTATSSLGASYLWTHRSKSLFYCLLSLALIVSTFISFLCANLVLLPASSANYPGAQALHTLHRVADSTQPVISVHLGNLACQTGITRFQQIPAPTSSQDQGQQSTWHYDKTENETEKTSSTFWSRFDYVLIEPGEETSLRSVYPSWEEAAIIDGFAGVRLVRPGDVAVGVVEERFFRSVLGEQAVGVWNAMRDYLRGLMRGWWVE
ncbi:dolichyl-P-Man:Man(7)GlcNAc(2)-PP-dolichol alpha-1,6-mannosyltransferase [Aspergillus tanneri]|nr:dolichyl-P-Man:Man(7)GlcNAc(2)-PP-dolichol alpha-1,6-mannosyltransferase [Aspergillus tanneri]KAA8649896.1 dolichyl-P-Man:Man(7)GlcNAc(2)-PP-dolichol alpha-1,6-mannosyltransferase [Aspergillus tanneri]